MAPTPDIDAATLPPNQGDEPAGPVADDVVEYLPEGAPDPAILARVVAAPSPLVLDLELIDDTGDGAEDGPSTSSVIYGVVAEGGVSNGTGFWRPHTG